MRKGFALPLIVVLIGSVVILATIAFLKFKPNSLTPSPIELKQSPVQSTANPSPNFTPNPVASPTTQPSKSIIMGDSVFYTNQVLAFSIEYPKSWQINECISDEVVMLGTEKNTAGRCGTEADGTIVIYKWSNITDSTKSPYENAMAYYSNGKKENVTINKNAGFRIYEVLNGCDRCPPKGTIYVNYIFKDSKSNALVFHYTQTPQDKNNLAAFDQMVSTFKFTN